MHERARAETVRAVIGEIGFTNDEETIDVAHQVVVDPEPAHRVVRGGVDAHRNFVGIFTRDALVHLEKVSVFRFDGVAA